MIKGLENTVPLNQGREVFSIKGQRVYVGSADHVASVASTQSCHCSTKTAEINACGYVSIKLYLQELKL